jgi:hypothetical protein
MGYKSAVSGVGNSKFRVGDKVMCHSSKPVSPACNKKLGKIVGAAEYRWGWEYRVNIPSAKGLHKHRYLKENELSKYKGRK